MLLAVDPVLYPEIEGTTDSEIFFHLALTLGLEDDPPGAVARAVGLIEETGRAHGVEHPIQMTVATTDGDRVWAFRYSSRASRDRCSTAPPSTRFVPSTRTIRCSMGSRTRRDCGLRAARRSRGSLEEVPEASYGVIHEGQDELRPFTPTDVRA